MKHIEHMHLFQKHLFNTLALNWGLNGIEVGASNTNFDDFKIDANLIFFNSFYNGATFIFMTVSITIKFVLNQNLIFIFLIV